MFTKYSKEPIKTWSQTWMIENQYHPTLITYGYFKKDSLDKLQLKTAKALYKLKKKFHRDYQDNQLQLLREVADKIEKSRFNFKLTELK